MSHMLFASKNILRLYLAGIGASILCVFLLSATTVSAATKVNSQFLNRLTNGLVGYWTFDAPDTSFLSSTATDKSGNSNTATLVGVATSTDRVLGKLGQAIDLRGVSTNYINIPHSSSLAICAANCAWSAWIYPRSFSGNPVVIDSSSRAILFAFTAASQGYVEFGGTVPTGWTSTFTTPFVLNQWQHIVVTRSGSTATVYRNGVAVGSSTNRTGSTASANGFRLGNNVSGGGTHWNGKIDDFKIYNRALSAAEAQSLYQMGQVKLQASQNASVASSLVGLWSFDGADMLSTRAYDRSGQGNTATLTNFGTTATTSRKIGALGQALEFDGVDDYLISSTVVNIPKVTISAWVKIPSAPAQNGLVVGFANGIANGTHDKNLYIDTSGKLLFYVYDGAPQTTSTPTDPIPLNEWVHVVGTADGTDAKAYVNGVEVGTIPAGDTYTAYNVPNILVQGETGDVSFGGGYMAASIDDVRIYSRAISADEVKRLYSLGGGKINTSQNKRLTDSLVGLWSFDGGDVNFGTDPAPLIIMDRSTNANHGTFSTTATSTSRVLGKIGQALKFNGTTDYMRTPTSSDYDFGSSNFAISWWEKRASNVSGGVAIARSTGVSGYNPFLLGYSANGANLLIYMSSAYSGWDIAEAKSLGSVTLNTWNHFMVTRNGSTFTAYKNGAQTDTWTSSTAFTAPSGNTDLIFGRYTYGIDYFFNGNLDDVRFYRRAFSAADVKSLYVIGK